MINKELLESTANELGVEANVIAALVKVESSGDAFLPSGEPKILFEAHWFSKLTGHKYDKDRPFISSKVRNQKLYTVGREHKRLACAAALDREAALQSASWGMFQLMGFNWKKCGFNSLQDFINAMYAGVEGQFKAFIGYVVNTPGMLDALKKKDWHKIAELYNGKDYKANKYDEKLKSAYEGK